MTNDDIDLDAVEARHIAMKHADGVLALGYQMRRARASAEDVPALIAEIRRLRQETR